MAGAYRSRQSICIGGVIKTYGSGGAYSGVYDFYVIDKNKKNLVDSYNFDYGIYYHSRDQSGEQTTKEEIDKKYPASTDKFEWNVIN